MGEQYLSDFVIGEGKPGKFPLDLILCRDCFLLQLSHTTPPSLLYTERYGYKSGVSQTMRDELNQIANEAESLVELKSNDLVLDIGANDGTLLKAYKTKGIRLVGFDPVAKFGEEFNGPSEVFINDYFRAGPFQKKFSRSKAKIITAIAMFYDLDDPNAFLADIVKVLTSDGIFIVQQNYVVEMLNKNALDNMVHEHLCYYSFSSLENLLSRHGLEIFDVKLRDINGGSFRTYICQKGKRPISKSVYQLRTNERSLKMQDKKLYDDFAKKVKLNGKKLTNFIKKITKNGKKVYVYGASTRGNTLLQYYGLDNDLIEAAVERNPEKWGKKIASVGIPIISEEQARKDHPDYMLVLPWHFREEFLEREKEYLANGGHFIFPLPDFEVV